MPRPIRIEYDDAYYHVMNRGRGHQAIFHSDVYYEHFLETLGEASERFGMVVHGYCLMGNHYHLLVQTRHANLGRIMRHINGVYTQRYNSLKNTDGSLFRGRYKAILVEEDAYLLQLSRYIHRNPVETKQPLVKKLEQYPWSSYPAYLNKVRSPAFLHRETLYGMLGQRKKYQGYKAYVEQGNTKEIEQFYNRPKVASVMGSQEYIDWLQDEIIPDLDKAVLFNTVLSHSATIKQMIGFVAEFYHLEPIILAQVIKGPSNGLWARKVAMYLCQQFAGYSLKQIMVEFGLTNIGSVSFITSQVRKKIKDERLFNKQIQEIKSYIINKAT